jgi:hypothetical protein
VEHNTTQEFHLKNHKVYLRGEHITSVFIVEMLGEDHTQMLPTLIPFVGPFEFLIFLQ